MMIPNSPWLLAAGVPLASRITCHLQRALGVGLIGLALFGAPPALADQTLMVADNGTVKCEASAKDLTRISLKGDKFASVSKIQTSNAGDDFQIVNEPSRGDIYLSVAEGYKKPTLSFFGITQKGYVYKFLCSVAGEDARQIFLANVDGEQGAAPTPPLKLPASLPVGEKAARLVKAMYEQASVEGFEQDWHPLTPVTVGSLKVQLIGLYRGASLVGDMLKIENLGEKPAVLTEAQVAPAGALAVSIVNPRLGPHEATTAYVVEQAGTRLAASGDAHADAQGKAIASATASEGARP